MIFRLVITPFRAGVTRRQLVLERWACVAIASLVMVWAGSFGPIPDRHISVVAQAGVIGAVATDAGASSGDERIKSFTHRPTGGRGMHSGYGAPPR